MSALLTLVLLLAANAGCSSDKHKGTGTGRANDIPETLVPVKPARHTGTTRAATTTVPATNSQGVALPAAPNDYAIAVYVAWTKGDRSTAAALAEDPAVNNLPSPSPPPTSGPSPTAVARPVRHTARGDRASTAW